MAAKCPSCGTAAVLDHSPFCSRRCAEVDLGRWFTGKYGVAAEIEADSADVEALEKAVLEAIEEGTLVKGVFGKQN